MAQQGGNGVVDHAAEAGAPEQPDDPLIGQVIDARYRIESLLGEGGMGIVYRATHTALNKPLAIKVLRPEVSKNDEIVARFRQEAQSASAIGNQHIIDISDFGVLPDGSTYFVMEFLEGCSLTDALLETRLSTERTIHIAQQLCKALGAAHERGIVHRDMKPDNVQLIPRGGTDDFVKVLDFGIAKVGGSNTKLTQAGQVFGTPHYMSPEQCAGTNVDHRTDIYAVGVILYEMGTGQVPFDADNLMGILTKHLYEKPVPPHDLPPPTDVPAALEAVILKCLAKKAEQRYQNMAELAADLESIERGTTPRAVVEAVDRQSAGSTQGTLTLDDDDEPGRMTMGVGQPAGVPSRPLLPLLLGGLVLAAAAVAGVWALAGEPKSDGQTSEVGANVVSPAEKEHEELEADAPVATGEQAPEQTAQPGDKGEPSPEAAGDAPDAPRAKMTLQSKPSGAEVYRDGDLVGSTPFALFKPEADDNIRLVLKREGYQDKSVLVRALSPESMSVRMTKLKKRASRKRTASTRSTRSSAPPAAKQPKADRPAGNRLKSEVLDPWD